MRKDLRTMLDEAFALGSRLPLTARALELYDEAARDGLGASDSTMLPAHWLRRGRTKAVNGITLPP
jgi:3-hydroxyisobutyrate dehydrogenase-like beta-hydroxyacid dehydrogenase